MNKLLAVLLGLAALMLPALATVTRVERDLQNAINVAVDGDTLLLGAGIFVSTPAPWLDNTCGNCEIHATQVAATRGFVIDGKRLVLRGRRGATALETRAGYGLLLLNSRGTVLENLVITGGVRDADGRATDGAVVVKNSQVTLRHCVLRDNSDFRDSTIVGIAGVVVREGGDVTVDNCAILRNSWDGVALYRGAQATVRECVIDSGRGAGIGVTWDAVAVCERNRVSHYWKGIGSFGTATVVARNNAVFENLGWGIIASGQSTLIAENNVSVRNGNCGIAIWNKGARGRIVNNISAFNGWRKEWVCPCVGFWNQEADSSGWVISHNLLWQNSAGNTIGQDSTGFILADPQFSDTLTFRLQATSPALGAGAPEITNRDGAPADLGIYGGPAALPK